MANRFGLVGDGNGWCSQRHSINLTRDGSYIIKSTVASWWWALIRTLTISGSCHNECSIDEDGIC